MMSTRTSATLVGILAGAVGTLLVLALFSSESIVVMSRLDSLGIAEYERKVPSVRKITKTVREFLEICHTEEQAQVGKQLRKAVG